MKNNVTSLSVLHYVYGAFVCVSGLAILAVVFLGGLLQSDWLMEQNGGGAPQVVAGNVLMWLGWSLFFLVQLFGALNIISGSMIARRTGATFSQVVAAMNCLSIPFGLALGIFTFVVLNNDEVRREYGRV